MNGNEFRNAEHPTRGGRTMSKSTVDEVMDLSRNLPLTRSVLRTTLQDAAPGRPGLLAGLLKAENASREQSRRLRPPEHAVFPQAKELDGCDWSMTGLPRDRGRNDLLTLDFIDRAEDLVLYGNVGTGKTHLAIALGRQACGNDIPVRFFTAAGLVMRLRKAKTADRLDREPKAIGQASLLVIDELGYPPVRLRRGQTPVPDHRRLLREEEEHHLHFESRIQSPGRRVRPTATWRQPSSTASSTTAGSSACTENPAEPPTRS